jgi:hypothetical protein
MELEPMKNAAISAAIVKQRLAGKSVPEAIDAVLGAGTYAKLAAGLYAGLRAKASGSES